MAGIRDGDCLCNRSAGVSFLEIQGQRVGISGAEQLFRAWQAAGREPADLQAAEILAGLRDRNYVSAAAEGPYVEAARAAYACWHGRAQQAAGAARDAEGGSDAQG